MTPKELSDLETELNTRRYSRKGETEMICSKAAEAIRAILANGYAPEGMVLVPEWPTVAQMNAGASAITDSRCGDFGPLDVARINGAEASDIYRAMLAAHKEKPDGN
jgi:hypothetical protein